MELVRNIAQLARSLGVHRPRVYEAIRTLTEQGLMRPDENGSKRRGQNLNIESPQIVLAKLRYHQETLGRLGRSLSTCLPEYLARFHQKSPDPTMRVYEGRAGFMELMIRLYEELAEEILWLGEGRELYEVTSEEFMNVELAEKRARRGIRTRILAGVNNPWLQERAQHKSNTHREVRTLPRNFSTPGVLSVSGATVALWNTTVPRAIVVEDAVSAALMRQLFELVWYAQSPGV